MKKLIIVLTLFISYVGVSSAFAQAKNDEKKEVFGFNKKYMDEAGLSASTQAKVRNFLKESNKGIRALNDDSNLSEEEKASKRKVLIKARIAGIFELLNDEESKSIRAVMKRINDAKKDSEDN